ncbi:hypothetical protein R3P38DRAFT_3173038 [Favolaschia claudopus]|uniref:Ribonuclease H1 N-terminal domain-containing protein n=1 Tax=Favolaschia claudopus TaxID=2862362 RepID=A0AAW0DKM6_9AGAR
MSRTHPPCSAPYRPSAGHEDFDRRSSTAGQNFYVVGVGFMPGIYTEEHIARQQVHGFSNGQWKKASTYKAAVMEWNRQCQLYHRHSAREVDSQSEFSSLDSPPSSLFSRLSLSTPLASPQAVPSPLRLPIPQSLPSTPSPPARSTHLTPVSRTPTSPMRSPPPQRNESRPLPARLPLSHHHDIPITPSSRSPGQWRDGDVLWGVEGTVILFEDRYDLIDHIYKFRLSPARVMESHNRDELEAFVSERQYVAGV